MNFEHWLVFVATYTMISLVPGPSVLMVVAIAVSQGNRSAFLCILGELLGGTVLVALALFGVGAVLVTSSALFQTVKWAGVFYMAYLGLRQIMEARRTENSALPVLTHRCATSSIRAGFFTAVLNPKAVLFYVALLSQFLDPTASIYSQFIIVITTSTIIVGAVLGGYALLAAHLRKTFQSAKARRRFNYTGGGLLLSASAYMATSR